MKTTNKENLVFLAATIAWFACLTVFALWIES